MHAPDATAPTETAGEYVETPDYISMSIRAARERQHEDERQLTPELFQRRIRILEALERTSQHLAIAVDVKLILERIAETIGTALGAKYVNFWGLAPDRSGVSIVAAYGMREEYIEHSRKNPMPLGTAWIGRAMTTGVTWSTSNVQKDPYLPASWLPVVEKQAYHGLMCTPLVRKDNIAGGMCVYYEDVHRFDYFEMSIATIVANQAATAVENARIFGDLEAERNKTTSIIYSLNDGLIMYDADGRVLFFNPRAQELLLVAQEDVLGKRVGDFAAEGAHMDDLRAIASGSYEDYKPKEYGMKARQLSLEITRIPVSDERGQVIGSMHILHDITLSKELERVKANFISTASHQLRTPLTGMRWAVDSLLSGDSGALNDKQKETMSLLASTTEHLVRLVNDLLDASRIEEGRLGLSFEMRDIVPLIREVAHDLSMNAAQRQVMLDVSSVGPEIPQVSIDADQTRLVLQNLLDNAIKYTPRGGTVRVTVQKDSTSLLITVGDTGIGIPDDDKPFIFSKFFRAKNAVRVQTDGSGLGLYIVKSIVEKHAASVRFESIENKGTTFFISYPLDPAQMPRPAEGGARVETA